MRRIRSLPEVKAERDQYPMMVRLVRLPRDVVDEIQQLATKERASGRRITESDIYRNAIMDYMAELRAEINRQDNFQQSM